MQAQSAPPALVRIGANAPANAMACSRLRSAPFADGPQALDQGAKADTPSFGRCERFAGSRGNQSPLLFRHGRIDVEHERVHVATSSPTKRHSLRHQVAMNATSRTTDPAWRRAHGTERGERGLGLQALATL